MVLTGKALVAQGGGPTAVINQSMVGVVLEAKKHHQITHIYGALGGVRGIINEDFIDLSQETLYNLEEIAKTPSSALLSTRDKPDTNYCKEMIKVLKAHDIRYFFYIGGNDSSDTVRILNEYAKTEKYEFVAMHIPKTVDNDLMENDHTPGYGSAARFVSSAFTGVNLDTNSLPGVYIGVVMGRNAGFLTASAALAQKYSSDGPHLIYLPERAFKLENFHADVKSVFDKFGKCIVAISEGIRDEKGVLIAEKYGASLEKDDHGNAQLSAFNIADFLATSVKNTLKLKRVRADTFGYLQRSFWGCVSDIDQIEAREVAERAVQYAVLTAKSSSIAIKRIANYGVDYVATELEKIAAQTRLMPTNFINEQGNHVTAEFLNYVKPLIGSNIDSIAHLRAPKVNKILK